MVGVKLYFLTDPGDISEAYKNSSSLSFDVFVKLLLRTCGSSRAVVEKLYQDPPPLSERKKSLGQALHGLQMQQSSPGPNLENLSVKYLDYFGKTLVLEQMTMNRRYHWKTAGETGVLTVSLREWCADVVINASQQAYFGDRLSEIDPNLARIFVEFDTRSWQLLYRFPRLISQSMYAARDKLIDALTAYLELSAEKKTGATWVMQHLEREMCVSGFTYREMGTLMMLQYWG